MTIVVYGHTHIVYFVWFCLFVVFMQCFKSLSVYLVSLPLDAGVFCVNCSLWSYTYCLFCVVLFVVFYAKSIKFVCFPCLSSSRCRRFP